MRCSECGTRNKKHQFIKDSRVFFIILPESHFTILAYIFYIHTISMHCSISKLEEALKNLTHGNIKMYDTLSDTYSVVK